LVEVATFEQILYGSESWHLPIIAEKSGPCTRA
jgi:hypothetical protein